jgi:hypothetical protein
MRAELFCPALDARLTRLVLIHSIDSSSTFCPRIFGANPTYSFVLLDTANVVHVAPPANLWGGH